MYTLVVQGVWELILELLVAHDQSMGPGHRSRNSRKVYMVKALVSGYILTKGNKQRKDVRLTFRQRIGICSLAFCKAHAG